MYAGDFVKGMNAEFPVVGNRWNLMRLTVENRYEREVDLHVGIYFDADSTLQYGRRIVVPPSTRIQTWIPVRLPDPRHIVSRSYPYHVLVRSLGDSSGLIPDKTGSMQLDRALQIETREDATGIIYTPSPRRDPDFEPSQNGEIDPRDFMLTGRYHNRLQQNWRPLSRGFGSFGETGLQGLKQLVIADDQLLSDPEGLDAVRRWLHGGGHLWVMLDKVDSRLLEVLLGDTYQGVEVETVELSSLQFVDAKGVSSERREYDEPVPMKRILIDQVAVDFTVDGWPAAFWIDYGQGRVLVTTLGPHAWVRPRTVNDPGSRAGHGWETDQVVQLQYEKISADLFSNSFGNQTRVDKLPSILASTINQYIGYQIPRRQTVIGILLGYSFLTFALAVLLWHRGRQLLFLPLGPLLATAAAATLVALRPTDHTIPSTAVSSEIVTPIPGTDDYQARGVAGLYSTDSSVAHLSGHAGGWFLPDWSGYPTGIHSLNYNSTTSWKWEGLRHSPGIQTGEFYQSGRYSRTDAVATFDERGVTGMLQLPGNMKAEDAILATRQGRIGVKISENGQFTATTEDILDSGQYLSASLLSDAQRRRSDLMVQLSNLATTPWNRNDPHFLFWTRPWDLGMEFGEHYQHDGQALVAVPMRFRRPSAGSRVKIPAPFIGFHETIGPNGEMYGGLYSNSEHTWIEKSGKSAGWFAFQLPDAVIPLRPVRALVQIDVSGPVGRLELSGWNGQSKVELKTWEAPVGRLKQTIEAPAVLLVNERGQLLLHLSAGEKQEAGFQRNFAAPRWKIESLSLSLEADIPSQPATQNDRQ